MSYFLTQSYVTIFLEKMRHCDARCLCVHVRLWVNSAESRLNNLEVATSPTGLLAFQVIKAVVYIFFFIQLLDYRAASELSRE